MQVQSFIAFWAGTCRQTRYNAVLPFPRCGLRIVVFFWPSLACADALASQAKICTQVLQQARLFRRGSSVQRAESVQLTLARAETRLEQVAAVGT